MIPDNVELGQLAFTNSNIHEFDCPEWIIEKLWEISEEMEETGRFGQGTPFGRAGGQYETDVFKVVGYDWSGEGLQQWNFKYGDFEVSWYKYLGRGTTMNREMNLGEANKMLDECKKSIKGQING